MSGGVRGSSGSNNAACGDGLAATETNADQAGSGSAVLAEAGSGSNNLATG